MKTFNEQAQECMKDKYGYLFTAQHNYGYLLATMYNDSNDKR